MTAYYFAIYLGHNISSLNKKVVGYTKTYEDAILLFENTDTDEINTCVQLLCLTTFVIIKSSVTYYFNQKDDLFNV